MSNFRVHGENIKKIKIFCKNVFTFYSEFDITYTVYVSYYELQKNIIRIGVLKYGKTNQTFFRIPSKWQEGIR